MNYDSDNKIWRVGGPLFVYFGIRLLVESLFYIGIWYMQFKEFNISAAFNGIQYVEQFGVNMQKSSLMISGVAMLITIPIMIYLMKKDYEYPVNIRKKEHTFSFKEYGKGIDIKDMKLPAAAGIMGALGVSRLILSLPIDGILGDYSQVQQTYEKSGLFVQTTVLCILSPVVEELIFRGLAYKRLKTYYDVTIAAYISGLMFGISHFNLVQGLYGFIMGIIFTFVYERYKNIVVPIVMHMAANMASVFTSINPVSQFIDKYWFIRIPVAVAETVLFGMLVLKIYREKKDNDEK